MEADGDFPFGVMRLELGEIGDVTDVIADAILLDILPVHFSAGQLLNLANGLENGNAILAATAEIIDLSGTGISGELLYSANHVMPVNIVANLLCLVPKNRIGPGGNGHFHKVRKKAVELDTGV